MILRGPGWSKKDGGRSLPGIKDPAPGPDAESSPGQVTPILLRSLLIQIVVLPLALTAFLTVQFLMLTVSLLNASARLDHTDRIIAQSQLVETLLLDMETGIRGYLITGRPDFLQPYTTARVAIDDSLDELAVLVAGEPAQSSRIATLRELAGQWHRHAEERIRPVAAGAAVSGKENLNDVGKRLMEGLRAILSQCIADQEALRDRDSHSAHSAATSGLTWMGIAALALGVILFTITRRKLSSVFTLYEAALGTARERSDALRSSEARFQAFMNYTPAMTFVKDEEGRYIYGNRAWASHFGKPIDALLGRSDEELSDRETARILGDTDLRVRETGAAVEAATAIRDCRGEIRQRLTLKFPLDDGSGQRLIGGISVDVTELRRAEQDLQASEERYTLAMRGSSAGLWDWKCENEELYLSPRFKELIGYDDREIENSLESFVSLLHPEDRERAMVSFREHLTRQVPYDVEYRLRTKCGEYRWFNARAQATWNADGGATRMSGSITDVTARKRAEAEILALNARLERRLQRLAALRMIDSAITAGLDLPKVLRLVLDQVKAQLHVDACDILLLDSRTQTLVATEHWGFQTEGLRNAQVPLCRHGGGRVALEHRSLHIADLGGSDETFVRSADFAREGFVAYHAVPLLAKGEVKGILEVFHRAPLDIDQEWVDFLEILASQTAIAVENLNLYEGLRRANTELILAYDATIEGWSHALDLRDKETDGHCRRVTEMTVRLARAMGVGTEEVIQIRRGALLHDIGKMGIPDRILLKPGPLDDEEWQIMRQHPEYAREMLSRIEFLRPAIDIPYCHHERWDGSGYPQGLKGEEIPLAARIFTVADIWDALSNDRPYRKAWPQGRVMDYIASLTGSALDPAVVEMFLRLHAAGPDSGLNTSAADHLRGFPLEVRNDPAAATNRNGNGNGSGRLDDSKGAAVAGTTGRRTDAGTTPSVVEAPQVPAGLTVLVADHQMATTDVLQTRLGEMGHKTITAADGREAWRAVRLGHVEVLIADWNLPGIDGPELCRRIRSDSDLASTYIILTGDRAVADRENLPADADDFLAKPIDPRDLTARLAVARRLVTAEARLVEGNVEARRMYNELRDQNKRLAELVATDPLTGLSNRRHLLEVLEAQAALTHRQEQPLSLAILDVDRFKQFNDVFGHRAGDEVLCRIADILRRNVRSCDLVARYGGEEFVVVMPMTPVEGSREVAERLRAAIAESTWSLRPITSSVGVATMSASTLEISKLVDAADQALYRSKQRGRDRVTHCIELEPVDDGAHLLPA